MRKCFETEEKARKFAEEVNGTVKQKFLPDYMSVIEVWVVEWANKADTDFRTEDSLWQ